MAKSPFGGSAFFSERRAQYADSHQLISLSLRIITRCLGDFPDDSHRNSRADSRTETQTEGEENNMDGRYLLEQFKLMFPDLYTASKTWSQPEAKTLKFKMRTGGALIFKYETQHNWTLTRTPQ